MHWTSRAGASEARYCAALLLVGDGMGVDVEHAVTAQASRIPPGAHLHLI
jgi:hypothetical protein